MRILNHLRNILNIFDNRAIILTYHCIADVDSDPWSIFVSPSNFDEQLDIISKYYTPISLTELRGYLTKGNLPDKAVIVTFDDGYANNLYNALPILKRYDIPATIFITSDYIGQDKEYWWDELERIFLHPCSLPESLNLEINGRIYEWNLGEFKDYTTEQFEGNADWVAFKNRPTVRHDVFYDLYQVIQKLYDEKREEVLNNISAWSDLITEPRKSHKVLSCEELLMLSDVKLIEIGCHTMTHPVLSNLPMHCQRNEIINSKKCIEELIDKEVSSFAYPFGKKKHYNENTISILKESGFLCACSNFKGYITNSTDLLQLPRYVVKNINGEEFSTQLTQSFNVG